MLRYATQPQETVFHDASRLAGAASAGLHPVSLTYAATSLLVFAALVASAKCGAAVRARAPGMLASGAARDVIRRVFTLIAVLAALMLGMGIASLKSTFDSADRDVRRLASEIEKLDHTLHRIGPAAAEARQLLARLTAALVPTPSPNWTHRPAANRAISNDLQDELDASLERLGAGPAVPRVVVQAQATLHDIVQTRWNMEELTGPTCRAGNSACWCSG